MQQPSLQRDTAAIDTTGHLISGLNSETLGKNLQRDFKQIGQDLGTCDNHLDQRLQL